MVCPWPGLEAQDLSLGLSLGFGDQVLGLGLAFGFKGVSGMSAAV